MCEVRLNASLSKLACMARGGVSLTAQHRCQTLGTGCGQWLQFRRAVAHHPFDFAGEVTAIRGISSPGCLFPVFPSLSVCCPFSHPLLSLSLLSVFPSPLRLLSAVTYTKLLVGVLHFSVCLMNKLGNRRPAGRLCSPAELIPQ